MTFPMSKDPGFWSTKHLLWYLFLNSLLRRQNSKALCGSRNIFYSSTFFSWVLELAKIWRHFHLLSILKRFCFMRQLVAFRWPLMELSLKIDLCFRCLLKVVLLTYLNLEIEHKCIYQRKCPLQILVTGNAHFVWCESLIN